MDMIIIHNYHVAADLNGEEECINCEREVMCPACNEALLCRDRRVRRYRDVDGKKHVLWIRRTKCRTFDRLHNELPDFVIPYKRHIPLH